jgi:hypothetical protein
MILEATGAGYMTPKAMEMGTRVRIQMKGTSKDGKIWITRILGRHKRSHTSAELDRDQWNKSDFTNLMVC